MATRLKQEDFIRLPQEPKKTIYRMLLVPEFLLRLLMQMVKERIRK
jgi:hypothetical protein